MAQYTLTYFDAKGLAEPVRIAFAAAGVGIKEVKIPFTLGQVNPIPEDTKPKLPFGQVPILEYDNGKILSQSGTIGRFVARRLGFMGSNDEEAARIEEICDGLRDFWDAWVAVFRNKDDQEKAAAAKKQATEVAVPRYLGKFEKILQANGGNFLVGSSLSYADLSLLHFVPYAVVVFEEDVLQNYPVLKKHVEKLASLPKIKEYLDSRPKGF